jgi:hypothetical protein
MLAWAADVYGAAATPSVKNAPRDTRASRSGVSTCGGNPYFLGQALNGFAPTTSLLSVSNEIRMI